MNPILKVLYHLLKGMVWIVVRLFYPKAAIIHSDRLKQDGPLIIVSNHPNTLLDPLNVAVRVHGRYIHFLANAGLFNNALTSWLLNQLYCIPIHRKKDAPNKRVDNNESFRRADEFLSQGGCLYIAPEGTSFIERYLREIKTGTARIALSAENHTDFNLGVKILPIGLNYEAQTRFGTSLVMHVGEPILVNYFEEAYRKDPFEASKQLTAVIGDSLNDLTINTKSPEEDEWLHILESIQAAVEPLPIDQHYQRTRSLLNGLRDQQETTPALYAEFKQLTNNWHQELSNHGLSPSSLTLPAVNLWDAIVLLLGFPFFIYGAINNFLPSLAALSVMWKANIYIGFNSAFKSVGGLVLFPLFYFLQTWLFGYFIPEESWKWWYLLSLFPTGWIAWQYWERWKHTRSKWRSQSFFRKNPTQKAVWQQQLKAFNQTLSGLLKEEYGH